MLVTLPDAVRVFVACAAATTVLYGLWSAWIPLLPDNVGQPLLDLGKMTGYRWLSALTYLVLILAVYGLYAVAYRLVGRARVTLPVIVATSAVFGAAMVFAYPATAVDIFGYVAQGRLLAVHGVNPFTVVAADFPGDPILPYLAFPHEPSQYGPAWALISGAVAAVSGTNLALAVVVFKLIGVVAHLASGLLVYDIARGLHADGIRARRCALVYLWNPLLIWEMVGNGHNDGLMMVGGLAAAWALARQRTVWVLPCLAAGALVKLPVAIVGPLLLVSSLRQRVVAAIEGVLLAVALVALVYRPFWAGLSTLTALRRTDLFTASFGSVLRLALSPSLGMPDATGLARAVSIGVFAVVLVIGLVRVVMSESVEDVLTWCYVVLLGAVLFVTTWFQAWYVVWPLAIGAALPRRQRHLEVGLLSLGGMLQYFVFIYLWVMNVFPRIGTDLPVQTAAYLCVVGPLLIGLAARGTRLEYRVRSRFGSR